MESNGLKGVVPMCWNRSGRESPSTRDFRGLASHKRVPGERVSCSADKDIASAATCNLYSLTTNQAAIIAFVRAMRYADLSQHLPGLPGADCA